MLETRQLLSSLYWDTSATTGLQAGNGTWSTSTICWNTAADGSGSRVAWTNGSDAVFSASGSSTITVSGTVSAASITVSAGTYSFGSGTLKLTGSGTVSSGATMELTSGTLSGAGTLTVNGTMNWTGGTMSDGLMGPGTTTVASTGALNISGSATKTLTDHIVNNNGTINWSGGTIQGDSSSTLNNAGALTVQGDNEFQPTLSNSGTLTKSGGTGTATISGSSLTSTSTGTFSVSSGTLDFTGGGTLGGTLATTSSGQMTFSSGTYTLSGVTLSGTGLNLNGGTFTLSSGLTVSSGSILTLSTGATVNGSGSLTIASGGTLSGAGASTIATALNNNGTVTVSSGTLILSGGGTHTGQFSAASSTQIQLTGGTVTLNGATLSGSGSYSVGSSTTLTMGASGGTLASGSTLNLAGGTINGSGPLSLNGTLNWTGGTMAGPGGTTTIGSGGTLSSSGTGNRYFNNRTLTNNGTITWSGGTLRGDYGATINNAGSFNIQVNDSAMYPVMDNGVSTDPTLNNSGTFTKSGGTGTSTISGWGLTNTSTGTFSVSTGTLDVEGCTGTLGGSLGTTSSGMLTITGGTYTLDGATFSGGGNTITAATVTLNTTATVAPSGTLTYSSSLSGTGVMQVGSTLSLESSTTFAGTIAMDGGTLRFVSGALGTSTLDFTASSQVLWESGNTSDISGRIQPIPLGVIATFNTNGNNVTMASVLSGEGGIGKSGTGTLTLTAVNTYTGQTRINAGTLQFANTSDIVVQGIVNSATLIFNGSGDSLVEGVLAGFGSLTKQGSGTLTLSGDNTFAGSTTISAGTLQIGDGTNHRCQVLGNIVDNAVLVIVNPSSQSIGGNMSGTGSLTKRGSGTLYLTGNLTYTGSTTVEDGSIEYLRLLAPTSLTATSLTAAGLRLDWTDTTSNEDGFEVQRANDPDFSQDVVTFATIADATSYIDRGLNGNITYYRVRSMNGPARSAYSNVACVSQMLAAPSLPVTGANTVNEGSTYTLALGSITPSLYNIAIYIINWGDDVIDTIYSGSIPGNGEVTHTYADGAAAGTLCNIRVDLVDEYGTYENAGSKSVTVLNVAPVLTLAGDTTVGEGVDYALALSVSDPGQDTISAWTIDWRDGTNGHNYQTLQGNPASVQHRYTTPGTYAITASATDEDGTYQQSGPSVTVHHSAPNAVITTPLTNTYAPANELHFSASSSAAAGTGDVLSYAWSVTLDGQAVTLPQGTITNAVDFTFTPPALGDYVVSASVSEQNSLSATATLPVSIQSVGLPVAIQPGQANEVDEGLALYFASALAPGLTADLTYLWSVSRANDPTYELPSGTVTDTSELAFTPADDGVYTVSLTVSAGTNTRSAADVHVTVDNAAPAVMIIGLPSVGVTDVAIALTAEVSDPGSADQAAGFTYAWAVTKTAGGVTTSFASGSTAAFSFTPDEAAVYTVTLTVTDKDDLASSPVESELTVVVEAPTASIENIPASSNEGQAIPLQSLVTDTNPDHQAAGFSYLWDVTKTHDGQTVNHYATSTAEDFTFTPDDSGTYVVTLIATACDGASSQPATATTTVAEQAPAVSIGGVPDYASEGDSIALSSTVTDPASADQAAGFTYAWDVTKIKQDVTTEHYATGSDANLTFIPDDGGTYVISLIVTDKDGTSSTAAQNTIEAQDVAPVATIEGLPDTFVPNQTVYLTSSLYHPQNTDISAGFVYFWTVTKIGSEEVVTDYATGSDADFNFTPDEEEGAAYDVSLSVVEADSDENMMTGGRLVTPSAPSVVWSISGTGTIEVTKTNGIYCVTINHGTPQQRVGAFDQISITGSGGDDYISIAEDITFPASINGLAGNDTLIGGGGNDTLFGGDNNDSLSGGAGDDMLYSGAGNDTLAGGLNNDTYVFSSTSAASLTVNDTDGANTLTFSSLSADVTVHLNHDDPAHSLLYNLAQYSKGAVTVAGADATRDHIANVTGGSGDDSFYVGPGSTALAGGKGSDTYYLTPSATNVTVTEAKSGGTADILDFTSVSTKVTVDLRLPDSKENGAVYMATYGPTNALSHVSDDPTTRSNIEIVKGGYGDDVLTGGKQNKARLDGGPGADTITGNAGKDMLIGGDGSDRLVGNGGNDTLDGGSGNDALAGNGGNDSLMGGDDIDTLYGGGGNNTLYGGDGNDYYVPDWSTSGVDYIGDERGNDVLYCSHLPWYAVVNLNLGTWTNGKSTVGYRTIKPIGSLASQPIEIIQGGPGADKITADNIALYNQTIYGNGGNDTLVASGGSDTLSGGDGDDTYAFTALAGTVQIAESAGAGSDTLDFSGLTSTYSVTVKLTGNLNSVASRIASYGGVTINADTTAMANIENVIGGSGDDSLTGNGSANRLDGGPDGHDTLIGHDTLTSADGSDVYVLRPRRTNATNWYSITESGTSGDDTLDFGLLPSTNSVTVNLATGTAAYSNVTFSFNNIENIIGGQGNDNITGNDGANRIDPGAGNATLAGGNGDDTYVFSDIGGSTARVAIINEAATSGNDTLDFSAVTADVTANLTQTPDSQSDTIAYYTRMRIVCDTSDTTDSTRAHLENVIGGSGYDNITGSSLANNLAGGSGNDTINGQGGNDTLVGNGGNDTYAFTALAGTVQITESAGAGSDTLDFSGLTFANPVTVKLTGNLNNVASRIASYGGVTINADTTAMANIENVIGGSGDDSLTGNGSANRLDGGPDGHDTLIGDDGSDEYVLRQRGANPVGAPDWYTITENGTSGSDTLNFGRLLSDNPVTVTLASGSATGTARYTNVSLSFGNIENVTGGQGNDTITGNGGANLLAGGGGNDVLSGLGGNDTLYGGAGRDSLDGGGGDDLLITYDGDGVDTLRGGGGVDHDSFGVKTGDIVLDPAAGTETVARTPNWFDVNSVSGNAKDQVLRRVAQRTQVDIYSTQNPYYVTQDNPFGIYVRNPNCWAADLDLTPISPWNSDGREREAGTLISPRDIILANHYRYGNGTIVYFVNKDGVVITRTVVASSWVVNSDLWVATLNADVTSDGISFCQVLPPDYERYIDPGALTLSLDQEEHAIIDELTGYGADPAWDGGHIKTGSSSGILDTSPSHTFYEDKVDGDSGNPSLLISNGQLVLLTCWHTSGAGWAKGSSVADSQTAINQAMAWNNSPYRLTPIDLCGFPRQ